MKRQKLNREQVIQIMQTVNPLGLTDCNGRLMVFNSAAECYEEAIRRLYVQAPAGWVDLALWMNKNQSVSISRAIELLHHKCYTQIMWEGSTIRGAIKTALVAVISYTGIEFSDNALSCALHTMERELSVIKKNAII